MITVIKPYQEFRAKRVDSNKWTYGAYFKHIGVQPDCCGMVDNQYVKHYIIHDAFADWNMERGMVAVDIVPDTVGRFTGETDMNENPIYEGDILKKCSTGDYYKVYWDIFELSFMIDGPEYNDSLTIIDERPELMVIAGNMYDNPKLLKAWERKING